MKILFIGNSFSQDATRYIEAISEGELFVRNIYIGGCSLETHAKNIETDAQDYVYEKNSEPISPISINSAILAEDWDVISIQQVSNYSGILESYEPYIGKLIGRIKELRPRARIVFHRTWAYDTGSTHPQFYRYESSRELMYKKIVEVTGHFAKKYSLDIIPTGDAIELARSYPEFDPVCAKYPLTRDTFHLSLEYGRYLAGLVLYKFFTGKSPLDVKFAPEKCDTGAIEILKKVANDAKCK